MLIDYSSKEQAQLIGTPIIGTLCLCRKKGQVSITQ